MVSKNKEMFKFTWRVIVAHVIAYFIAGIFAVNFFNYSDLFTSGVLASFMKPTTEPIVMLGPTLQIFRGIIMALVLLPIYKVFTEGRYGFLKLGILIVGLSVLSTFAAASGSIDGFIYTKLSIKEQLIGYPEALLWIASFMAILWAMYKFEKKAINIIALLLFAFIVLITTVGYVFTTQAV